VSIHVFRIQPGGRFELAQRILVTAGIRIQYAAIEVRQLQAGVNSNSMINQRTVLLTERSMRTTSSRMFSGAGTDA
jgi:hypothetical protein